MATQAGKAGIQRPVLQAAVQRRLMQQMLAAQEQVALLQPLGERNVESDGEVEQASRTRVR